ncbi:MAG: 3'-5' exonuclease [Desulfobulbus sp.]
MNKERQENRQSGAQKISKEAINELPLAKWQGPVLLVRTIAEAKEAAALLNGETVLGFDTETRPAFKKGQKFNPSLLQLAGTDTVCLFQLQSTGLPGPIIDLLGNPSIVKAGVAPDFDLQSLQAITPFSPGGFIDLARMARQRGIRDQGLRGLAALVCAIRISKSVRTTNWAKRELTQQQIQYAATDAWISREIYLRLQDLPPLHQDR